jgi:hypothetical protein
MALRSERVLTTQQGGARLEPPANAELLTPEGLHSQAWALHHQRVADRLAAMNMGGTRSGPVTSDANGRVTAKFEPAFVTAVTYVAIHDFAGIAVRLDNIEATQEGFTGILMSSSAVLYDYTTNFWAVGY